MKQFRLINARYSEVSSYSLKESDLGFDLAFHLLAVTGLSLFVGSGFFISNEYMPSVLLSLITSAELDSLGHSARSVES